MSHADVPRPLRIVVVNDSPHLTQIICEWLRAHGHTCTAAAIVELSRADEQLERLIAAQTPDVVIYDVGRPYLSSWDLLDLLRMKPSMAAQRFVVTTANAAELEKEAGPTAAFQMSGTPADLQWLLGELERPRMDAVG